MCLCDEIRLLATNFNETKARSLSSDLNKHLATIRALLGKSKSLSRDVRYQIVPNNSRVTKILSLKRLDTAQLSLIRDRFEHNIYNLWTASESSTIITELRRRIACVAIYLRSRVYATELVPPQIASLFQGSNISELRYAGRKYIKIARKIGSIGSILWLPLEVPASTYERYLNIDDDEALAHLASLGVDAPDYTQLVHQAIAALLKEPSLSFSYYNLVPEYGDLIEGSDLLLLLMHALGGSDIPIKLLQISSAVKRRWTAEGEIEELSASDFGVPPDIVRVLTDETCLARTATRPEIQVLALEDGTPTWSIHPELRTLLSSALASPASDHLLMVAIKLLCFATPPPLEGNTSWPLPLKNATWAALQRVTEGKRIAPSLKTDLIESLAYFSERDSASLRRIAVEQARALVTKSMPYYFHALVTLFECIMYRIEGSLHKSISSVQDFFAMSTAPVTRLENALKGRLHIAQIEAKIQLYDTDIASCIYGWKGTHPLSTLEIEVTRRLQGTASRFFQSVGDFPTARASLEQHLWLNSTKPIRHNTRLLIIGRLAEIYCELHEYQKAVDLLRPEFDSMKESEKKGRPYRRLLLASVEANIGQEKLDAAESILHELADIEPQKLDDMNEQTLHMRRAIAKARTAHEQLRYQDALQLWRGVLDSMGRLQIFSSKHPWTVALIYLSMAHAQIVLGDMDGGKRSWAMAVDISRTERCEYVIPVVANTWLRKLVSAIHHSQGWPFRMMLPGGKPDVSWP